MRLADDERARVPFALVGVLLLVGSSTFAASLASPEAGVVDDSVDVAMDRVDAETTAALRVAVREAARAAAADPVTTPANTTVGRALGENRTFRNYLRLRIALSARGALSTVEHRRGDATARASLPAVSEAGVGPALRDVSVSPADGGRSLTATVRNVSLVAVRDGRVVAERTVSRRVTVAVPTLALHDRTADFQRRLNRSPVYAPGLKRRATAGLLAVAEARGLAQHAGAPVDNVVANRHVALSTNAGVLAAQRASFGRTDPDAARGVRAATLRTGLSDALPSVVGGQTAERLVGAAPRPNPRTHQPLSTQTFPADVGGTADDAFLALLGSEDGDDAPTLAALSRDGYTADVTVISTVTDADEGQKPAPDPLSASFGSSDSAGAWTLVDENVDTAVSVHAAETPAAPRTVGVGERAFETTARRVLVRHTVSRTWVRNGTRRTTTGRWTDDYRVRVAVVASLRSLPGPERSVTPLFDRGGALSGPNLASVPRAAGGVLADRGGADAVARRAALSGGGTAGGSAAASTTHVGERPESLREWVYLDVAGLRERVRNVSVEVAARDAATGHANAAAELAAAVRDRRTDLVDAPAEYDGVADRVRVAARAAYVDRVLAALDERAAAADGRNDRLRGALASRNVDADAVRGALASRAAEDDSGTVDAVAAADHDAFVPDGDPAYLSLSGVDGAAVDGVADGTAYTPLAARNTNLFTLPYGDLADSVVGRVFGGTRVSLRTAGRALVAADRTLAAREDATLRDRRDALAEEVDRSLVTVRLRAAIAVRRETAMTPAESAEAVDVALARWRGPGARAVAASNGSLAAAVASEVSVESDSTRDRLATALRVELREATTAPGVRVPEAAVNGTASRTRTLATELTNEAASRGADRLTDRVLNGTLGSVPAGLPLSPTLNPWVATANLWVVEARGAYARFAVSAGGGAVPTTYVRDGSVVRLDVDGDGTREVVGSNERIGFEVRTVVVAVVPPAGNGVGDVDGDAFEASPAWAGSAPGPRCDTPTGRCPRE
ncbi:hypothetical protein NDI76_04325 [Halogeometricum sp. S1BR25-6]|uniref:Uncharacterized protein n=1 Tax=Halogeometricum salsisoli TaxID=2950536 RepID=A0ABU2GB43_9EURY|nr:hypothetical protein [Halogeometricum sp. S1BR25-6]MDS0297959.1 hypothetical protein [Halogeometricum sp. S1BR25-6]